MKTLQLIIKEKFLAEIVSGTKLIETRDIRPKNASRYIVDIELPDGEKDIAPKQYDAIQFYAGYNVNRKKALVEVLGAEILIVADENGQDIELEEDGEIYLAAIVEYRLGKVLEHNY
ncbi:hypothetical protein ACFSQD_00715 [Flavihumibacter stibioxidans]|uniref:ASCH domain-containing protein n=1 Tax=Flavihumibacter stibioxidans TaxID=1834163 RepID=A0ABR7MDC3_9BACT|nr:ASCH domain-containing protein [Flavihumibacter stibioxidans]MBC6493023.1 hypothetical protein [Flavihumibacter stibioxidans]